MLFINNNTNHNEKKTSQNRIETAPKIHTKNDYINISMPLSASNVTCIHQLPARLSNPEENTFSNSSPHHIFQGRDAVDDSSEKKRKGQRLWMICQSILSSSAPPFSFSAPILCNIFRQGPFKLFILGSISKESKKKKNFLCCHILC